MQGCEMDNNKSNHSVKVILVIHDVFHRLFHLSVWIVHWRCGSLLIRLLDARRDS